MIGIAFLNQKGGVGKTTLTHSLGFALANMGQRVLIFDLDSQANLTQWCGVDPHQTKGFAHVVLHRVPLHEVVTPVGENVDLVPGQIELIAAQKAIEATTVPQRWVLKALQTLDDSRWDYVLFDTAPGPGALSAGALMASEFAVVPIEPASLSWNGLSAVLETISEIQEIHTKGLQLLGVVPMRIHTQRRITTDIISGLTDQLPDAVLPGVREDVRLAEAPNHRLWIGEYAPNCRATSDLKTLASTIQGRLHG